MVLLLVCPHCLDAREREMRDYQKPKACPDCGALLLLSWNIQPHLVLQCRECDRAFEGVDGQPAPGMRPVCPECGASPGNVTQWQDE